MPAAAPSRGDVARKVILHGVGDKLRRDRWVRHKMIMARADRAITILSCALLPMRSSGKFRPGLRHAGNKSAAWQQDMEARPLKNRTLPGHRGLGRRRRLAGRRDRTELEPPGSSAHAARGLADIMVRNIREDEGPQARRSASCCSPTNSGGASIRLMPSKSRRKRPQFTDEMKAVLNSAKEIIAVGASSEEIRRRHLVHQGPRGRARAARRAEKIAVWVREALDQPIPVRKLNVGHHTPTGADDTSDQRRVVIILVLDHDEDANIDQSLRKAMAGESRARRSSRRC